MPAPETRIPVRELRRDPDAALQRASELGDLVWVRAGRGRFLLTRSPDAVRELLVERSAELAKPRSQRIAVGPPAPEPPPGGISPARLRRALAKGMGAERAAETADLLASELAAATAGWQDGERVRLMPWLRPPVIRAVVGGAFASSLSDAEVATLEGFLRWSDRTPRVEGRGPSRHGLTRPAALARLSVVARSLLANVDLSRPSELSALVLDHGEFATSFGDRDRQALAGELLVGAVGPLVQSAGWTLFRLAENGPPDDTQAFVREVTRLHPTNPHITRVAVADTTIGGEPVPAHTRVILDVAALHRDPQLWDDPDRFRPERWLDGRAPEQKFVYAAFGIGDRRCLGEAIALRALAALVETIGRSWELAFDAADETVRGRRQLADTVTVTARRRRGR